MNFYRTGGDEASAVLVLGRGLLHLGADGVQVQRHPGAAGAYQQKSIFFVTIR